MTRSLPSEKDRDHNKQKKSICGENTDTEYEGGALKISLTLKGMRMSIAILK